MKLTSEQIKSITFGAVAVREVTDGYLFERSTEKQINAWYAIKPDVGARAEYSTGVTLDLHTSSKTLRISAVQGDTYDVYVNGLLRASVDIKNFRDTPVQIALTDPLGKELGEVRVTVYLPHGDCPSIISNIELDDGASVIPHKFRSRFLFLGDSISQGYSAAIPSLSYTHSVSRFFDAECFNQCVGGGVFDVDTLDDTGYSPDTVIIGFGTNDYNHFTTAEEMERCADEYLGAIKRAYSASAKNFFVISPIWRGDLDFDRPMGSFQEARQIVIRQAKKHGMTHIDGLSLIPPIPSLYDDGYLHPNDSGFAIYSLNLIKQLSQHLN